MHEPYLHFTHGDPLWFAAWAPRTRGAMGAVCITLVLLAVLQRLFASARGVLETEWRKQYVQFFLTLRFNRYPNLHVYPYLRDCRAPHVASEHKMRLFSLPMAEKRDDAIPPPTPTTAVHVTLQHYSLLRTPPFILAHDLGRGLAFACEAAVSFLILLAVW